VVGELGGLVGRAGNEDTAAGEGLHSSIMAGFALRWGVV
jgi:hypothetical protein